MIQWTDLILGMGVILGFGFAASLLLSYLVRGVARRRGFVDRPGGHKGHESAVALGGGIAIAWTTILPVLVVTGLAVWWSRTAAPAWLPEFVRIHLDGVAFKAPGVLAVLGGAIVLHIVGLVDDVRVLGPGVKFATQGLVAVVLAAGFDIRLFEFLPWAVSVAITVFWIVVITNAFNFLDNMDGLSAGVAAIAGTIFAVAGISSGQIFVPTVTLLLVGACLGFLVFNFAPASIFMGDAGSLVIGYLLSVLAVLTTFYHPERQASPAGVLLPVVVLAVPLYDVVSVIWHRRRAGVSIFRGDRRHFSHRLVQRGFTTRSAVLTIYLATAASSLAGALLPGLDWFGAALVFAQSLCVVLIIAILESGANRTES
jgi:UDP-GlcNAc:undecaprenyl-phosphate GlcNAc-1-phosphate transferase